MTVRDGNGWTRCRLGHRHWGRHGAAGLLVAAPDPGGRTAVLLQQRSFWVSHGGTWGPPGGARDSHESAVRAALREAAEECGIVPEEVSVHGVHQDDHGGWTYQTVLANAAAPFAVTAASEETRGVAWVPVAEVGTLRLHPGFAEHWPALGEALAPLTIIVDAANVMGARPDGWWRDRAGAASRLCGELAGVASQGVGELPQSAGAPGLQRWFPQLVVVLEGAAKAAPGRAEEAGRRLRVVRAAGSGDDEIAALAAALPGCRMVVTADRELRARCLAAGASVTGPRWLLGLL
jgi:8-oxo-dGTP pyrophosphatase MutT (NUDIX family)